MNASSEIDENGRIIEAVQTVRDAIWEGPPAGSDIIELIVHPDQRRRGLARGLLRTALEHLAVAGRPSASLTVDRDNVGAQWLYCSCGLHLSER